MEHPFLNIERTFPFINLSLLTASSNSFTQQLPVLSKPHRMRKKKIYNPLVARGKWTHEEQQVYISFLQTHFQAMNTSLQRKSKKVFLAMSQVIQTRDADQCRSHHQKMLLYRPSLAEIVKYYRRKWTGNVEGELKNIRNDLRCNEQKRGAGIVNQGGYQWKPPKNMDKHLKNPNLSFLKSQS